MNSFNIFITLCLGVATASVVRRQATPGAPTMPPMKTDILPGVTNMVTSSDAPATPPPPPKPSSTMAMGSSTSQPPAQDTTPMASSTMGMTTMKSTMMMMTSTPGVTTPPMVSSTTMTTNPPAQPIPTTTHKPTIDELVTVDEILAVFGNIATSDFFKKLPFEDQLLVMEILAGGETGKMTAILDEIETKHLLNFMYNLPFKYVDPLWRIINVGYTREEIIA